jgi:hypothetical protein
MLITSLAKKMVKIGDARLFMGLVMPTVAMSLAPMNDLIANHGLQRLLSSVFNVRGGYDDGDEVAREADHLEATREGADQQPLEAAWSSADSETRQVSR